MNFVDLIALVAETIVIGIFTLQCVQHHSLLRSVLVLLGVLFITYSSSLAALAAPYFQTVASNNVFPNSTEPQLQESVIHASVAIETGRK